MKYVDALTEAMTTIAREDPRAVFMGQAVACPGTGMTRTFEGVPRDRLLEMPVAEDMQLGAAIGLSLAGILPVCVYPRWDFLLLAFNQLVNHLDKLPDYGNGYAPKVIIRVAVGAPGPLNPGHQHLGSYAHIVRRMTRNIRVVDLDHPSEVLDRYHEALGSPNSHLLVERMDLYQTEDGVAR